MGFAAPGGPGQVMLADEYILIFLFAIQQRPEASGPTSAILFAFVLTFNISNSIGLQFRAGRYKCQHNLSRQRREQQALFVVRNTI